MADYSNTNWSGQQAESGDYLGANYAYGTNDQEDDDPNGPRVIRDTCIFIDHTMTLLGFQQFARDRQLPKTARLDFEALLHFLESSTTDLLNVTVRHLAASPPLDEQDAEDLAAADYTVHLLERIIQRKNQRILTREQCVAEVLALQIATTLLEMPAEKLPKYATWPPRIVLVTGDGGHLEYLRGGFTRIIHSALHKGFPVAVWSFRGARSDRWIRLYSDIVEDAKKGMKVGQLHLLDLDTFANVFVAGVKNIQEYLPPPPPPKKKKKKAGGWGTSGTADPDWGKPTAANDAWGTQGGTNAGESAKTDDAAWGKNASPSTKLDKVESGWGQSSPKTPKDSKAKTTGWSSTTSPKTPKDPPASTTGFAITPAGGQETAVAEESKITEVDDDWK